MLLSLCTPWSVNRAILTKHCRARFIIVQHISADMPIKFILMVMVTPVQDASFSQSAFEWLISFPRSLLDVSTWCGRCICMEATKEIMNDTLTVFVVGQQTGPNPLGSVLRIFDNSAEKRSWGEDIVWDHPFISYDDRAKSFASAWQEQKIRYCGTYMYG